jgi:hypothetical protein
MLARRNQLWLSNGASTSSNGGLDGERALDYRVENFRALSQGSREAENLSLQEIDVPRPTTTRFYTRQDVDYDSALDFKIPEVKFFSKSKPR